MRQRERGKRERQASESNHIAPPRLDCLRNLTRPKHSGEAPTFGRPHSNTHPAEHGRAAEDWRPIFRSGRRALYWLDEHVALGRRAGRGGRSMARVSLFTIAFRSTAV